MCLFSAKIVLTIFTVDGMMPHFGFHSKIALIKHRCFNVTEQSLLS